MIVGFDAKRAFHNYSGLGNYSRLLIHSLSELYKDNQYFLYTPKYKSHPLHDFIENENCTIVTPTGITSMLPSSFWRTFFMTNDINKQKLDIFHGLSGELPVLTLKMPKVVTIHDVIFMRYPEYYTAFDRKMYEKKFKHACKIADKIITVSKQTAEDCIQFLGADAQKIEVGYQSCDPIFWTSQKEKQLSKAYDLPEKFILNIGTIEARKNLLNLVKALKFVDDDVSLVAIGGRTPYTLQVEEYIKENHLEHRVKLMHGVPFRDFPALYADASVFVYPSVFEGFGIPVLEALAIGTPVATSNISSMPEVGGDAALYFDPYCVEDMVDKINLLLHDKETVARLRENRAEQLDKFAIQSIAKNVNDIYQSI
ncbi:MAG: glycosyltransferase family 4 protein [Bacteroidetes bacterium]|nr:glycosyltransferase family 4 protein [Bacteroidota bacterium]MCL2302259.1 glycosyltransferase family 4 protein [Lentimicrobiaceae bacterium]